MLTGIAMFVHAVVCILLAVVILMQSGRGGGLTEGFQSAESLFGAQTNEFMIKATTVVASIFLVTCLGIAVLSSKKSESLMGDKIAVPISDTTVPIADSVDEALEHIEQEAEQTADEVNQIKEIPELEEVQKTLNEQEVSQ